MKRLDLIRDLTREVSEALPKELDGWCAIGATLLAARLNNLGIRALVKEGRDPYEAHCWVEIEENLVADPTIGQFCSKSPRWYVGPPHHKHHTWDLVLTNPDFEEWPDEQQPHGPAGQRYTSP